MHQEQDRKWRFARLGRAGALAEHVQRDVALLGPVFVAPDLGGCPGFGSGALRQVRQQSDAGAGHHSAARERTVLSHVFRSPLRLYPARKKDLKTSAAVPYTRPVTPRSVHDKAVTG